MAANDQFDPPAAQAPWRFASTRWSLVAAAGQGASPAAQEALATLCQMYWYPLYAYARRHLGRVEDAQDATQEFFSQLLEKDYLQAADPNRGKFRSYLLTAFKNFLSKERARTNAQKRGGGRRHLSLDFQAGETRYHLEPADRATPDSLFERRWALTLLEQALVLLRQEYTGAGKNLLFEKLKSGLTGDGATEPYSRIGEKLGMSEPAVKVAVHRLRQRYKELLRGEIAQTVANDDEIDDELRDLFNAVRAQNSQSGL
jgi:RNA polymerase sigma-70 factor (ECF subfamily)